MAQDAWVLFGATSFLSSGSQHTTLAPGTGDSVDKHPELETLSGISGQAACPWDISGWQPAGRRLPLCAGTIKCANCTESGGKRPRFSSGKRLRNRRKPEQPVRCPQGVGAGPPASSQHRPCGCAGADLEADLAVPAERPRLIHGHRIPCEPRQTAKSGTH